MDRPVRKKKNTFKGDLVDFYSYCYRNYSSLLTVSLRESAPRSIVRNVSVSIPVLTVSFYQYNLLCKLRVYSFTGV